MTTPTHEAGRERPEDVWPSARYRRLSTSHLRPWRMDYDGFYVRRLSQRQADQLHGKSVLDDILAFADGRIVHARDEETVMKVNTALPTNPGDHNDG